MLRPIHTVDQIGVQERVERLRARAASRPPGTQSDCENLHNLTESKYHCIFHVGNACMGAHPYPHLSPAALIHAA